MLCAIGGEMKAGSLLQRRSLGTGTKFEMFLVLGGAERMRRGGGDRAGNRC